MAGVPVPLGVGAYARAVGFQPRVILKNMYVEQDRSGAGVEQIMHIQRPGCAVHQNVDATGTSVRGLFHTQGLFGSLPVAAIGTNLFKFNGTTATDIGNIAAGTDRVQFAATNFGIGVLAASTLYFHDQTTLTSITVPESRTPTSITSINSYIIIGCSDGTWYWLDPSETVIDPLHFATAESMPDNLVAVHRTHDEVFFFGTETTEMWQPTGVATLILTPAMGRRWDIGAMSRDSIQPLDNSLYFVGSDGVVYRVEGQPLRKSNEGIEERIRNRTGNVSAFTYTYDGHAFYCLYIPGQGTFAFDVLSDKWSEFDSEEVTGWRPRTSTMVGTTVLLGDSTSGKVFNLDPTISSDDGVVFERAVSGVVAFDGGRRRNDSLEVWTGSSEDLDLRIRWHDGPETAFTDYWTATSHYPQDIVRFTRLGAARQPLRTIEISTIHEGQLRISRATANAGREA